MTQEQYRPTGATLVSAVIPSRDRSALLARAVASALAQTHPAMEVIVVDDGSTDDTPAVLAALADPRLRIIRRERTGGVSAARNVGIRAARGAFVALLDSDDEWLPEKTAKQLAFMAAGGRLVSQTQEIWMRGG
ncbi:MAG: glycosyltransferase family 2 protein, partial [Acidobacteriota bacterium]